MNTDRLRELVGAECVRLAKLGIDGMRKEFRSRGIQGLCGIPTDCPLARAINDTLMIGNGRIGVCRLVGLSGDRWGIFSATQHTINAQLSLTYGDELVTLQEGFGVLRQFAEDFDGGLYPELQEPCPAE